MPEDFSCAPFRELQQLLTARLQYVRDNPQSVDAISHLIELDRELLARKFILEGRDPQDNSLISEIDRFRTEQEVHQAARRMERSIGETVPFGDSGQEVRLSINRVNYGQDELRAACDARMASLLTGYNDHKVYVRAQPAILLADYSVSIQPGGEDCIVKVDFREPYAHTLTPTQIQIIVDGLAFLPL